MSTALIGLLLAAFAAIANSAATLLESAAANVFNAGGAAPGEAGGGGRWRGAPLYLLGLVVDVLGWLLSVAALRFLPIFVVQSVVAEQVAITVVVGGRMFGMPARARDLVAAAATVVGLGVIAASGAGSVPTVPAGGLAPVFGGMVAVGALASWVLYRRAPWLGITVLAATCFSATAVLARGIQLPAPAAGAVGAVLGDPAVWLAVGLGLLGTVVYVWALTRGSAGPVLAVLSVTEVLLPGTTGMVLLGDTVRPGWAVPCAIALVAALAGTTVLATSPTQTRLLTRD